MVIRVPRDRYGDAVRARRRELRERRARIGTGHRAALRDSLAVARTDARAAAGTALAALRPEIDAHLAGPRPRALVTTLPPAVAAIVDEVLGGWTAEAQAAVRGTAARRGLRVPARWPQVPEPGSGPPPSRAPARPGLAAALADPGVWRVAALPLVIASLVVAVGATTAGPPLLFPAAGATVLVLVAVVHRQRAAVDRALLRGWCGELLAGAAADLDARLARATATLAATAGTDLDTALDRHGAALDAELTLLTTGVPDD